MMITDLVHNKVTWTRYRQRRKCEDKELVELQAGIFSARSWCFQEVKEEEKHWKLAI